jgi:RNA-directed DNA polymerase
LEGWTDGILALSKRSNNQLTLAFGEAAKGTSPGCDAGRTELDGAETETGHPAAQAVALMERIVARDNLRKALKRVRENKGAAGIDGMSVDDLALYLKEHWPAIRTRLLDGSYKPQPVRRVEIPKPGGGKRPLGIPIRCA